jgi:AcrR family transcriptional regulator
MLQQRADARRNSRQILDAARRLVGEHGAAVQMEAIAREAGVAVGTLYRHHPTKADLVAAVVEDAVERVAEAAEASLAAVDEGRDPGAAVEELLALVAARQGADRAAKAALTDLGGAAVDHAAPPAGSAVERALTAIARILAAAAESGSIRSDVTVGDLVHLLAGVPDLDVDPEGHARVLAIVLRGIRAA